MTTILSARRTVESRCAMTNTVRSCTRRSRASWILRSVIVSTLAVASSRMTKGGFFSNTRAIVSRCFSPWLRRIPFSPILVSRRIGKASTKSLEQACSSASMISSSVASSLARRRLSRTVPSKRKGSWATCPTLSCSSLSPIWRMSTPESLIVPPLTS